MKEKCSVVFILAVFIGAGAYFIWNNAKLNELTREYEIAATSLANYEPLWAHRQSIIEYEENYQEYPAFFEGDGFKSTDFSVRDDLKGQADEFTAYIAEREATMRQDLAERYKFTYGSQKIKNNILALEDERAIRDIVNFSSFYSEKNDFLALAKDYCSQEQGSIEQFVEAQDIPTGKKAQLDIVLHNAELNLCPKL